MVQGGSAEALAGIAGICTVHVQDGKILSPSPSGSMAPFVHCLIGRSMLPLFHLATQILAIGFKLVVLRLHAQQHFTALLEQSTRGRVMLAGRLETCLLP